MGHSAREAISGFLSFSGKEYALARSSQTVRRGLPQWRFEAALRLAFAIALVAAGIINSPNPFGYLRDASALGQALIIVGFLQFLEAIFIIMKAWYRGSAEPSDTAE